MRQARYVMVASSERTSVGAPGHKRVHMRIDAHSHAHMWARHLDDDAHARTRPRILEASTSFEHRVRAIELHGRDSEGMHLSRRQEEACAWRRPMMGVPQAHGSTASAHVHAHARLRRRRCTCVHDDRARMRVRTSTAESTKPSRDEVEAPKTLVLILRTARRIVGEDGASCSFLAQLPALNAGRRSRLSACSRDSRLPSPCALLSADMDTA